MNAGCVVPCAASNDATKQRACSRGSASPSGSAASAATVPRTLRMTGDGNTASPRNAARLTPRSATRQTNRSDRASRTTGSRRTDSARSRRPRSLRCDALGAATGARGREGIDGGGEEAPRRPTGCCGCSWCRCCGVLTAGDVVAPSGGPSRPVAPMPPPLAPCS
eukprot:350415-Chlamydomonas_euryale.AAC.4